MFVCSDVKILRQDLKKHKPMEMRHILAGTTQDHLHNRISDSASEFSGLLPSTNALRKHRRDGRAADVTYRSILNLVVELGRDTVIHYQHYPSFLLVLQTPAMVS